MILADTQPLHWWREDRGRLGPTAITLLEAAWIARELASSAISFWEIGMLESKGRLSLPVDADQWRLNLLNEGLVEIPLDGGIGLRAARLVNFHGDPADRMIVATALNGHQLLTTDRQILDWDGPLQRINARR